ncbi:hypothetical protein D915_009485, partial [Fasciola hepatica]
GPNLSALHQPHRACCLLLAVSLFLSFKVVLGPDMYARSMQLVQSNGDSVCGVNFEQSDVNLFEDSHLIDHGSLSITERYILVDLLYVVNRIPVI